jgi:CRP-like cAMP-binding protein
LIKYLKKLQVFKDLLHNEEESYEQLTSTIEVKDYKVGEDIILEGENGDSFYFILQGKVEVLKAQMIPINAKPIRLDKSHEEDHN